eukprot:3233628-Amphidinium_carterae.1
MCSVAQPLSTGNLMVALALSKALTWSCAGRSGVYTFRSALELNDLADYYKFYQNSTYAESLGFMTFGCQLSS